MFDRSDVTYIYDGSFAGFLCCVFQSYMLKEAPRAILSGDDEAVTIFDSVQIVTDMAKAQRVQNSIVPKMGPRAAELLRRSFLSCLEQKELHMLDFMQLGYEIGHDVVSMLAHPTVSALVKAVNMLDREVQHYKGFVRFSVHEGLMAAVIAPRNNVLPCLTPHFAQRFPRENFMIYDKNRRIAVMKYQREIRYTYEFDFTKPSYSEEEVAYQKMWRLFHKTIAIKERDNPICQRNFMPKRYWEELTEMQSFDKNVLTASKKNLELT